MRKLFAFFLLTICSSINAELYEEPKDFQITINGVTYTSYGTYVGRDDDGNNVYDYFVRPFMVDSNITELVIPEYIDVDPEIDTVNKTNHRYSVMQFNGSVFDDCNNIRSISIRMYTEYYSNLINELFIPEFNFFGNNFPPETVDSLHIYVDLSSFFGRNHYYGSHDNMLYEISDYEGITRHTLKYIPAAKKFKELTIDDFTTIVSASFEKTGIEKLIVSAENVIIDKNVFGACDNLNEIWIYQGYNTYSYNDNYWERLDYEWLEPISLEATIFAPKAQHDEIRRYWKGQNLYPYPIVPILTTLPASSMSDTKAIISADVKFIDNEGNTGFEWRRYDAPELVPSNKVACPVVGGLMSGRLNNLSANTYYKYRPYYEAVDGTMYYGEWMAFCTADAYVYFEPVVSTYEPTAVTETSVTLSGYALGGSDDITEQGFEYFPANTSQIRKVKAEGERMTATLTDLLPGTTYNARAYVIDAKGITRGQTVEFTTAGEPQDAIEEVESAEEQPTFDVWTLQGVCVKRGTQDLSGLRPGLYIANGRKVLVR